MTYTTVKTEVLQKWLIRLASLSAQISAIETPVFYEVTKELRAALEDGQKVEPFATLCKGYEYGGWDLYYHNKDIPDGKYDLFLQPAPANDELRVPEGWKLVPIEPTPQMIDEGQYSRLCPVSGSESSAGIYKAMLSAAPTPTTSIERAVESAPDHRPFAYSSGGIGGNQNGHYSTSNPPATCLSGTQHASDCAEHNEPAYPSGPCDCGVTLDATECGNCFEGKSDMDHACHKCLGTGATKTPPTNTGEVVDMLEGLNKCPQCGGAADNGHDRCVPPSAYMCRKCCAKEDVERATSQKPPASQEIKPHRIAQLVNELRDIAVKYHDHQSLRERLADPVHDLWKCVLQTADSDTQTGLSSVGDTQELRAAAQEEVDGVPVEINELIDRLRKALA